MKDHKQNTHKYTQNNVAFSVYTRGKKEFLSCKEIMKTYTKTTSYINLYRAAIQNALAIYFVYTYENALRLKFLT